MFFDFGDDGEILRIINYDWDVYVVPEGRYEIVMTIPANNMADKNEKVISFVCSLIRPVQRLSEQSSRRKAKAVIITL